MRKMLFIKNLVVTRDDKQVLNDLSLVLGSGELHVLMGPNGSGKSTLASTIMGHPSFVIRSGQVIFDNQDVGLLPVEKRARAGIFLACQYPQEVPGVQIFTFLKEAHRMLTNIELSVADFKQLMYQMLDIVNLDASFAYRNLNEGFSGGEKKKFELVQLLLFKPKLAILDEIDSGLDVDALKILAQVLTYAKAQQPMMSMLMITHYNRILEYIQSDYVHVLTQGRIVRSGDSRLSWEIEQRGYDGLSL